MSTQPTPFVTFKTTAPDEKPEYFSTEGEHVARCVQFIRLGLQPNTDGTWSQKCRILFEMPFDQRIFKKEKLEPKMLSKKYSFSNHTNSWLYKDLLGWKGQSFWDYLSDENDFRTLLGQPCIVTLTHEPGRTQWMENITKITHLPPTQQIPKQYNESRFLTFQEWDERVFKALSEKTREEIMKSPEYKLMRKEDEGYEPVCSYNE